MKNQIRDEKVKIRVGISDGIDSHNETIQCPTCGAIQEATVFHTVPWYSYVHHCFNCGLIIMESDWCTIDDGQKDRLRR